MAEQRQTQSYLRNLFARRGIAPQHRFGQNFLIDLNLHEVIANAADVQPADVVLEVGPGAGALTSLLAERASAVIAVDLDPGMVGLTKEATSGRLNVRVLHADALANKNTLNPEVLDNVRAGLAVAPDRRFKLVANLPYNVATPIISNLLVHPELRPVLIVATIQLELAERMRAAPQSPDYGALSVLVQALGEVEILRTLSPKVFWPRPKVESAIIRIRPDPARIAAVGDLPWFHAVVRRLFLHRRKVLRRVVYSLWRDRLSKEEVDALLEGLGLTGQVRAEAMDVDELIALAGALKARLGEVSPAPPEDDPDDAGATPGEDDTGE